MIKHGNIYHVQLSPKFQPWLDQEQAKNPEYTEEQILYAALVYGLNHLRQDEKPALKLKSFYPPRTTRELFPMMAVKMLAGRVCMQTTVRRPRMYTGLAWM
jgi:hypothetical protein